MTPLEYGFVVGLLMGGWIGFMIGSVIVCHASYRNGVTDGYGYAVESWNPGYAHAGEYLREHMQHRWPALRSRRES